mmetsp:Transcript_35205/g.101375  ORF Transcript_35205/g.101375 Transcript_35205/m.101375 type:complete len:89 (+) Transcript_35205:322-588(+)
MIAISMIHTVRIVATSVIHIVMNFTSQGYVSTTGGPQRSHVIAHARTESTCTGAVFLRLEDAQTLYPRGFAAINTIECKEIFAQTMAF